MDFKALTWNIKSGHYQDENSTLPVGNQYLLAIAQVIANLQPDVVCLQEVEVSNPRSCGLDQTQEICAELNRLTGQYWHQFFLAARQMNPGYFGNAIISPHHLQMRRELSLPRFQGRETRSCLVTNITAGGQTFQVGTFHLGMKDEAAQAAMIKDWLQKSPLSRDHLLLGGDLNCDANSKTYQVMREYGFVLNDAGPRGCTFRYYANTNNPQIDFWFTTPDLAPDPQQSQIIPVDISDHRPLLCTVMLDN
ncbi:MAG: endonuclease/exonuclease/phosphatase family protein [Methylocystaceae bacterium]